MKNLKIFIKVFLSHSLIGLVSVSVLSVVFYFILRDSLIQRTMEQLSSINILKKRQIENYFSYKQERLLLLEENEVFLRGKNVYETSIGSSNQAGNEFIHRLKSIKEFSAPNRMFLVNDQFQYIAGSLDTFLLNAIKRTDFTVNIECEIVDASGNNPSQKTLLLYVLPLVNANKLLGYIIVEDDITEVQQILNESAGMGSTGESYLVGNDKRMRSLSRFLSTKPPLEILVNTEATNDFLTTESDRNHVITDYRGKKVLSYYRRLNNKLQWNVVSEIDLDEAMEPIVQLRNYILVVLFIITVVVLIITFFLSNSLSNPILSIKDVILKLSRGIMSEKTEVASHDEIGQITAATNQLLDGIKRTTEFANEIGSGNFTSVYNVLSPEDTLGLALIHMREQLIEFNEREIRLVREKTSAVLEAQENERKRIVLELHDGVGQLLTAVRLRVERMENRESLLELVSMINETIAEVKRVSYNLMPNAIVDFGLEAALKGLCENTIKYSSLLFDFQYVKECDQQLSFDISIAVFRIIQEALNNVLKHAHATRVDLHIIEKSDEIYFLLRDNGKGFDELNLTENRGLGLNTMRERAKMLKGNLEIESQNSGTVIEVHIPMN